jgi:predicted ferric reductase
MEFIRKERGRWVFYILLAAIPYTLWVLDPDIQLVFTDYYSTLTTIAKIAGIVGICFFAGNLILSGRYKLFDRLFGGLDRQFLFHHETGIVAFVLLTIHPLLITLRLAQQSWTSVLNFILRIDYLPTTFGTIAYSGLLVIILVTLFVRSLKYERLKFIHRFMGMFFFFGGLHVFFIPSDVSFNQPLRWYILTIVGIALTSYLVRTVFKKLLVSRIPATVLEVNRLSTTVTEVVLKPERGPVAFLPGQFFFHNFVQDGFPNEDHPFSITASTEEGTLRMSAKMLGDFTTVLPQLKPGAKDFLQGPYGGFSFLKGKNKKQIWIAGGIGITPFISMARTLRDRISKDDSLKTYDISLVYSVQTKDDLVYHGELQAISQTLSRFTYIPWVSAEKGFLTAQAVNALRSLEDVDIYICGPQPLLHALQKQLKSMGVPQARIHFELFKLL